MNERGICKESNSFSDSSVCYSEFNLVKNLKEAIGKADCAPWVIFSPPQKLRGRKNKFSETEPQPATKNPSELEQNRSIPAYLTRSCPSSRWMGAILLVNLINTHVSQTGNMVQK